MIKKWFTVMVFTILLIQFLIITAIMYHREYENNAFDKGG